ncbi:hypothetical protein [Shimia sp. SDUM112013]|uniref:hypothetical protein n=1 Tax=Shimia sp. SDUM112013 TaxID=3136160 RepID=UPI0032ECCCC1
MSAPIPFDATVAILIHVFLACAMFCIGASATLKDMAAWLSSGRRRVHVLLANLVVPPVVALVLIALLPVGPAAATVLLLLAFAPGGINAVQFSTKASGQLPAAGALLIVLSLLGLVTAPFAALWVLPETARVALPVGSLLIRLLGFMALPLTLGMVTRQRAPEIAARLYKPVMLVSTVAFIASVVLSLSQRQDALAAFSPATFAAMLIFIASLMGVGLWLGGPDAGEAQVLAVTTNLRNVGLVYVLVEGCCSTDLHATAVLAFMALMVPSNLVLTIVCGVLRKRR